MDAQLDRQAGHHYDGAGVNSGVQDEVDEQHHEKKSMFRKVKDKAKKLKNSITKHGNGGHDDDEDDEDDDETITKHEDEDEMEVDPAVHDSSADVARHGLHSEKPTTAIGEDPYSIQKTEPTTPRSGHVSGQPTAGGEPDVINGLPLPVIPEKRVLNPSNVKDEGIKQEGIKFNDLEDLEDAQHPRGGSNYQTKSIDHTGKGGQAADVASLIQSFEKTGLHGNTGAHSGLHGDSGAHSGVHGDSGVPTGLHGDSGIPGGLHGDSRVHSGLHGDSGVPRGLHGDSGVPRGLHGDSGVPSGLHGESGVPGGVHHGVHGESGVHHGVHGESGVHHGVHGESGVHGELAPPETPASTGSHGHFAPESFPIDRTTNPTGSHDQFPHESFPAYKSASPTGSHDQFPSESFPIDKTENPTGIHDQFPSESFPTDKTANPTGSHAQFPSFPKSSDHIKPVHLHHDTTEQKPSDQGSYIGMITSAVPSVITDTAISAKNVVASKLGYGPAKDAEAPRTEDDIAGATKPASSITDKAISAKNVGASKLGYGDAPRTEEIAGATKPVSALETSEFEESPKPASYTDKVISAKNVVASKLGYGSTKDADAPRTEEIAGARATTPMPASETREVEGSAKPTSITDKVISAKNAVASKLGYGGTKDAEAPTTEHIARATHPVSGLETGEVEGATKPASSPTYVQGMAAKVTGTLAPVYAKVADTGSSVISRVTGAGAGAGTGGKEGTTVSGDDKGTSVKEYLYEKFKPGEEEKALSREISGALHLRKENPSAAKTEEEQKALGKEPKTLGKVVDATGEEPRVLAEAKKEGDDIKAVGSEKVNKGVVNYVKDTVSSWVGKGGQEQQQQQEEHTQGSTDSHAAAVEVPLPGETGHPQSVSEDKKME